MYQVLKRDGKTMDFDISKISAAMIKAFEAQKKQYHPSVINMLALQVSADFEPKIKDGFITVEDIQDSVEKVLSDAGYADIAKAYLLSRKQDIGGNFIDTIVKYPGRKINKIKSANQKVALFSGAAGGIRTLGRLLTVTRFPVVLVMTSSIPLHRRALFRQLSYNTR